MKKNKGIILGVIILIIIIAGFFIWKQRWLEGFYGKISMPVVSPTNFPVDETNDWKTYESENYGFKIKYPSDLIISEGDSVFFSLQNKDSLLQFPVIAIKKIEIKNDENFENIILENTVFDASGMSPKSISDFEIRNFGVNQFYYIKTGLFEGVLSAEYYFIQPKFVFQIGLRADGVDWTNPDFNSEDEEIHKILKQMLLNFEVLDLSASQTMQVKAYFCSSDDVAKDCKCTNAVTRIVPKTESVARAALEGLIKGPTQEEKDRGLSSVIATEGVVKEYKEKAPKLFQGGDPLDIKGDRVEILGLRIENGVAYIDFSKEVLIYGTITASCGGNAFISSVENTLTQFSSVKEVKISIEGEAYPEKFF